MTNFEMFRIIITYIIFTHSHQLQQEKQLRHYLF